MTATPLQLDENEVDACLSACRYLSNFIDKGDWRPEHPLEQLLVGTLARGRGTFETIIDLVEQDRTLQAAMLGRPLFEDMAVAHWIALHAEDPGWLLAGFARHADAMRLQEASIAASVDWINPLRSPTFRAEKTSFDESSAGTLNVTGGVSVARAPG